MGPNYNITCEKSPDSEWQLYSCKTCHMWMYSFNRQTDDLLIVMNNLIKRQRCGLKDKTRMPSLANLNLY